MVGIMKFESYSKKLPIGKEKTAVIVLPIHGGIHHLSDNNF